MRGWLFGLVFAVFGAAALAAMIVVALRSGDVTVLDLEAGECFVIPIAGDETDIGSVEPIDCAEPHDAEVLLVGELDPDRDRPYPDDDTLFEEIDTRCAAAAATIGEGFGLLPVAPNEAAWEPLGGRFLCVAVPLGPGMVTGSVAAGATV